MYQFKLCKLLQLMREGVDHYANNTYLKEFARTMYHNPRHVPELVRMPGQLGRRPAHLKLPHLPTSGIVNP